MIELTWCRTRYKSTNYAIDARTPFHDEKDFVYAPAPAEAPIPTPQEEEEGGRGGGRGLYLVPRVLQCGVSLLDTRLLYASHERLALLGGTRLIDEVRARAEAWRCPVGGRPGLAVRVTVHLEKKYKHKSCRSGEGGRAMSTLSSERSDDS